MSQNTFQTSVGGVLLSSTGGPGPWQGMTDASGVFVAKLSPASYLVTASKDGYVPQPVLVIVGKKDQTIPITLVAAGLPDPRLVDLAAQLSAAHATIADLRAQLAAQAIAGVPDPVFVGWGTRVHA